MFAPLHLFGGEVVGGIPPKARNVVPGFRGPAPAKRSCVLESCYGSLKLSRTAIAFLLPLPPCLPAALHFRQDVGGVAGNAGGEVGSRPRHRSGHTGLHYRWQTEGLAICQDTAVVQKTCLHIQGAQGPQAS